MQIKDLMVELSNCNVHFMRCLKPNTEKKPNYFNTECILSQIKYLGLLDTIKIRKQSFQIKQTYISFLEQYKLIVSKEKVNLKKSFKIDDLKENCKKIIKICTKSEDFNSSEVLFGKRKIYLKKSKITEKLVELLFEAKQKDLSNKIKKQFEVHKFRQSVKEFVSSVGKLKFSVKKMQANHRSKIERGKFLKKKKSSSMFRKIIKYLLIKRSFKKWIKVKVEFKEIERKNLEISVSF